LNLDESFNSLKKLLLVGLAKMKASITPAGCNIFRLFSQKTDACLVLT